MFLTRKDQRPAMTSNFTQKLKEVEIELARVTMAYEEMVKKVSVKNEELILSNQLLQDEIIERKKIEAEILEVTQEEQRRFGSQLHDGLCQELTAILVFAKALIKKMEKEKTLEIMELKKISDMLLDAVDQARDTARGLYPGELEGTSLMHSLEELCSQTLGAACAFHCPETILIEDNNIATHLYRIAQEAISNALQHGKAKNIEISFTQNKDSITLALKDDGVGMIQDIKASKGIGLKIMKYRAHMMNATFEIKPNTPQGVILECHLKKPEKQRKIS